MCSVCGNSADFSIIYHDLILSNSIACRVQTPRCTMMRFSLIDSAINWLWLELIWLYRHLHAHIYIWDRYSQNRHNILPNFLLFAWFDNLESNRLPCSSNKMYDDAVFADRFRSQFTMFVIRELVGLFGLLHPHIAYEIYTATIFAAFFLISYWLHDLILFHSIVCHVQRARCTMRRFLIINSDINWLMFEVGRVIPIPWYWYCIWNSSKNHHHW